jgi:hypothetical protein
MCYDVQRYEKTKEAANKTQHFCSAAAAFLPCFVVFSFAK